MIVLCPSCHTRYRHEAVLGVEAAKAHCSECDEHFPLEQAKRTYVLLPLGSEARTRMPVGVDDPQLADRVGITITETPDRSAADPNTETFEDERTGATPAFQRPVAVDVLVGVVPAGLGSGLAYYLAGLQQADPVTWSALGGAIGLLLGWSCLVWIRRKD